MRNLENISYISQSGSIFESQSGLTEATPTDSAPSGSNEIDSVEIAGGDYRPNVTSLTYCGEAFMSFRNMLKRYNYHTSYLMPRENVDLSSTWLWNFAHPRFPTYKGSDGTNPFLTEGSVWTKMTLMNYLTPAFAARRGGIRWKYNLNANVSNQTSRARISASRWFGFVPSDKRSGLIKLADDTENTATSLARTVYYSNITGDGATLTNGLVCPTLELESPYYRNTRYEPTHDDRNALVFSGLEEESVAVQVVLPSPGKKLSPLNGAYSVDTYVAAGEDFTLDWFIAVPTMYYNDPTPV